MCYVDTFSEVICCDSCPKVAHLHCAGLNEVPEGDWHCEPCLKAKEEDEAAITKEAGEALGKIIESVAEGAGSSSSTLPIQVVPNAQSVATQPVALENAQVQ